MKWHEGQSVASVGAPAAQCCLLGMAFRWLKSGVPSAGRRGPHAVVCRVRWGGRRETAGEA